jgi:hypothetical protein
MDNLLRHKQRLRIVIRHVWRGATRLSALPCHSKIFSPSKATLIKDIGCPSVFGFVFHPSRKVCLHPEEQSKPGLAVERSAPGGFFCLVIPGAAMRRRQFIGPLGGATIT